MLILSTIHNVLLLIPDLLSSLKSQQQQQSRALCATLHVGEEGRIWWVHQSIRWDGLLYKRKLMANASCEPEGGGCHEDEIMVGRFTSLPDQVVHHIVSFLAITDLTRFGCVSKKCREIYLTSPSLKFDEFSSANTSSCYKRMNLLRSLDKFLIHRGDNKIHQFCVRWVPPNIDHETPCFCGCNEKSRTMAWIHNAVRCNVEVLDLEISIFEEATPLAFPFFILLCKSLRSLLLDMSCMIQTPSFTVFSSLKCLELKNVRILDESFFKWISNSCKCIEELDLDDVHGIKNINIESSSLKSFYFQSVNQTRFYHLKISGEELISIIVHWRFYLPLNKSFSLSAPNLKRFYWFGNLLDLSNLGERVCLEDVGFYTGPEDDETDYIEHVYTTHKRFVVLNEEAMKGLYKRGIIPPLFRNICYLCMHIGSFVNDLVPWMVFLFRRMPNLCTLYIKSTPPLSDCNSHHTCGFYMEYWKQQNFGFILELNEVTIELSRGLNGIELARYMLEHAQNLKKMVIVCLPQQSGFVKRMLDKSKMISNGTVVFKENRQKRKLV